MAAERYPLHAAERLRNAQRNQAEHALARASSEVARAKAEVAHAEQRLLDHLAAAPAHGKDADEPISALELQRVAAFAQRHATHARELRAQVSAARARAGECEQALLATQRALTDARASEQVIEHDRERFEGVQRREREHSEQADVDEQVEQTRLEKARKDRGR